MKTALLTSMIAGFGLLMACEASDHDGPSEVPADEAPFVMPEDPIAPEVEDEPASAPENLENELGDFEEAAEKKGLEASDFGPNLFVNKTSFDIYVLPGVELEAEEKMPTGSAQIMAPTAVVLPMPAPYPKPSTGDSDKTRFLRSHNVARCMHGLPDLKWSTAAEMAAKRWASTCRFQHEQQAPWGDNLAWGTAGYFTPERATYLWYRESQGYPYGARTPPFSTMHFTQMVWKETSEVGCARAACSYGTYFVCRYTKRGNVIGNFAQNVPRPVKTEAQCTAAN